MLIKRLLKTWLQQRRAFPKGSEIATSRSDGIVEEDRVEQLPGFNKLVRARHGFYVANENDVYIGRALIYYGEYCELEWQLLQQFCQPGGVVVEVGANIGCHTVSIGKAVGPTGRVLAIEPQPVIYQTLCANLALNSLTNVDAVNCGCGCDHETAHLPSVDYTKQGNFGGVELRAHVTTALSVAIEMQKLDDLLTSYRAPNLLKIDAEGMEAEIIEGGSQSIREFQPVMYVENDRGEKARILINLIRSMGYRMWWHIPPLFNPNNYFANSDNLFPGVGSFNMLCVHESAPAAISGLKEVDDTLPKGLTG